MVSVFGILFWRTAGRVLFCPIRDSPQDRRYQNESDATVAEISSPAPGSWTLVAAVSPAPYRATVRALRRRGIRVLGDVPDNGLLLRSNIWPTLRP